MEENTAQPVPAPQVPAQPVTDPEQPSEPVKTAESTESVQAAPVEPKPVQPESVAPIVTPVQPTEPIVEQTSNSINLDENGGGVNKKIILGVVLGIILVVGAIFSYYMLTKNTNTNQPVPVENTIVEPTATPTPSAPQSMIDPNDASDTALNQDATVLDKDLENVNADLKIVDQSFSDQQTNLQ